MNDALKTLSKLREDLRDLDTKKTRIAVQLEQAVADHQSARAKLEALDFDPDDVNAIEIWITSELDAIEKDMGYVLQQLKAIDETFHD